MRTVKGLVVFAAMGLAATGTAGERFPTYSVGGSVVCGRTGKGVSGVVVTVRSGTSSVSATTDAAGAFRFSGTSCLAGFYDMTLDLSAADGPAGYALGPVYIGCATPYAIAPFQVEVPGCAPPPTADCSPGYYKNHPDAWCGPCGFTAEHCNALLAALKTKGADGAREAAKAEIDACFGTAGASPCEDDDP